MRACLIGGALASGLGVGTLLDWTRQSGVFHLRTLTTCIVLAICSYLLPTLAVLYSSKHSKRTGPVLVLIAFLGTTFFYLSIVQIPNEITAWRFRNGVPVLEYFLTRLPDQFLNYLFSIAFDGLLALLIISIAYYLGRKQQPVRA